MQVEFLKQFSRDLDKPLPLHIKEGIMELIEQIEAIERITSLSGIKKLRGHRNAYRIRIGDYRIGFFVDKGVVVLARVLHRNDIYKSFP